ncbi:flagellar hook-associated protein FlgL [Castellaniella denitrificans]|jgi:flagellar hook-associated protein 3 FlgL|uniref:flagellar hook-associated protein FlgL n=1 Tax=Castellaniella denitrificans TaxID=56119 RepID=UPI001ACF0538|nr:flagellar hook-associated protein FlgL [Burkholderiales bacterium]
MRISSSLVFQTGLNTINMQQSDLMHLYQQIGTGQKMVTPADDPLGASQAINLSQSQAQNARYADNRAVASQNLGTEEDALSSLTLLLQDVRTRLVEASNGTLSDADRATLSNVLKNARDSLMGIANTTDGNGQYLFSGSQGGTPAYGSAGNYQGDALQRNIQADQTRQIAGGDVGSDVFQRAQPGTRAYVSYADGGNGGTAVLGQPAVTDNTQGNASANYSFSVNFTTPTTYEVVVTDVTGATTPTSPLSRTFTAGQTTLDLGYGTTVQISGSPASGDQFDVKPLQHEDVNLFETFDSVIAALNTPAGGDDQATASLRNVLNTAMQRMATSYDNVLTVRASVGARMNELSALDNTGAQRNLGYASALSGIEDLDYYEATTQLSLRKMALEGAGLAFQTIQGLSLFNRNQ